MAIALAGWLWHNFKLKSFIDFCIWEFCDDLLRRIDHKYCLNASNSFNYQKRNSSTSHVHMMLSVALSQMIDKTECIFFLNTPDSIKPYEGIEKTESPWLYSEISMTQIIRENKPKRFKNESLTGDIIEKSEKLLIKYNAELGHLKMKLLVGAFHLCFYIGIENIIRHVMCHHFRTKLVEENINTETK